MLSSRLQLLFFGLWNIFFGCTVIFAQSSRRFCFSFNEEEGVPEGVEPLLDDEPDRFNPPAPADSSAAMVIGLRGLPRFCFGAIVLYHFVLL
jgi:hypothetical protein